MSEKKTLTPEEAKALLHSIIDGLPRKEFEVFSQTHHNEIVRERQIILLKHPDFLTHYTESVLRQTAHVLVFTRHHKDDDGWGRPRKPKPEPPAPQGNGVHKILEPA